MERLFFTGQVFALLGRYSPAPPPASVAPPMQWGDPNIVRDRLGANVKALAFARDTLYFQTISPQHARLFLETNVGPLTMLVRALEAAPEKLATLRSEIDELAAIYFEDNHMRQGFLMTRAIKV